MKTSLPIQTIIIDDEPLAIDSLKLLIEKYVDGIEVISSSSSAFDAREMIIKLKPELVFVDIQMPGLNGIQLIQSIPDPSFHIVFVTAFDKYAIEALRINALDYILKPAQPEDLNRVVKKINSKMDVSNTSIIGKLNDLQRSLDEQLKNSINKIGIAMQNKVVFVENSMIVYCRAEGPYTHLYLSDGKKLVSSKTLGEFESQLSAQNFFRIHHSTLINIGHIREFQKNDGAYVIMDNNEKLEISHRKKTEFIKAINNQLI
jgi:two-component system LytT family response regulator